MLLKDSGVRFALEPLCGQLPVSASSAVLQFFQMTSPEYEQITQPKWKGIWGEWDTLETPLKFLGKGSSLPTDCSGFVFGVAASSVDRFTEGSIEANIRFEDVAGREQTAGVILGFKSMNDPFFYVEFGDACGFSISNYTSGLVRPLVRNQSSPLRSQIQYALKVTLRGRIVELRINDVKVAETVLSAESAGHQVAALASGHAPIVFEDFRVKRAPPRAFVATEFTPAFNRVWNQVIRKAAEAEGFKPIRIDDVAGPNPILADIKRHVAEAAIVIAEITPLNANVFYELGYADALNKPLVILAQTGTRLPFDIQGYRTVFYDDVIGGEVKLMDDLRKQLRVML